MLPNKSTGGLFVTAKMKALALIKANAIYPVSCYTPAPKIATFEFSTVGGGLFVRLSACLM